MAWNDRILFPQVKVVGRVGLEPHGQGIMSPDGLNGALTCMFAGEPRA